LFAPHIIVLREHPVRGESHIQRNATGEVATFAANVERGDNSSVVKCPPLNWEGQVSVQCHWVNCRSASWARAFTSTASARSTIQASVCRQFSSPKLTKKMLKKKLYKPTSSGSVPGA